MGILIFSPEQIEITMKFSLALIGLFAAIAMADDCQVYRTAAEKFAVELSSRQPGPESLSAPTVCARMARAGLVAERSLVWSWSALPRLAQGTPSASTNVLWMPLVLAATAHCVCWVMSFVGVNC